MYNIILKWQTYEVSLFDNDEFIVENIENLTWANSELALTTNPYTAGDNIANARPMARDIGITIKPTSDKGDYSKLVHKLGRLFNKEVTLVWKDREIPANMTLEGEEMEPLITDVQLSGIVNEFEAPRFDDSVRIQMNIHCPNPFWETVNAEEYSVPKSSTSVFCPYTEVDCGITIGFISDDTYGIHGTDYFVMRFDYQTPDDSIPPTEINIKRRYTDSGIIGESNMYATFEKGKVEIYEIYNGEKYNYDKEFTFSFLRGVKTGENPTTWQMEEINELPAMKNLSVPFFVSAWFEPNVGRTNGVISWKPLFL